MDLKGKVAIVTGGTAGIGLETAKLLKKAGCEVVITARNQEKLKKAADELGIKAYKCDQAKEDEVLAFYNQFKKDFDGKLDILINNAAYGYFDRIENIDLKQFNAMYAANVSGVMLMTREAVKIMIPQKSGNIINISSTSGLKGHVMGTAYSSSKFALKGMTESWRAELRQHNIRVMLINPSEVQTDFTVNSGREPRPFNATKLIGEDIAHSIISALEMHERGFITELTVFATNPQ